jgi:hypothetical protein
MRIIQFNSLMSCPIEMNFEDNDETTSVFFRVKLGGTSSALVIG